MSYWNAKYTNEYGEYEITFASRNYNKAKAVEKICEAVIDETVDAPDDIEVVVHGRWKKNWHDNSLIGHEYEECSICGCMISDTEKFWDCNYCPNCGAKMDGERKDTTD